MKDRMRIEEYDVLKLKEARAIIDKVYEYHYGDWKVAGQVKRLETILKKLDALIGEKREY